MKPKYHKPYDVTGRKIKLGDVVRVIGIPDLKDMTTYQRRDSLPVFKYLVGKYKVVSEFSKFGLVGIWFRMKKGTRREINWVAIEPDLLRVRRRRTK